jgi:glycosyltransferase involved in cell wall biosynthesis
MSSLRVALVHNFHAKAIPSGEDAVVLAEAAALARGGVDVQIVGTSNDDMATRPFSAVRAATAVATGFGVSPLAELTRFRPDIVHVHGTFPYLDRRWLRRIDVPIVATSHNYRAVCANGYLFRDGHVCTRCLDGHRWSGVRYGCYRDSRLASVPHAVGTARGAAHDPVLAAAHRVLALSDRARSVLLRAGVPEDRVQLDHHFLPDDLDGGIAADRNDSWLFVGRLSAEKGIDKLVAQWPDSESLRIVGDGELRPALERAAAGRPIRLVGKLPRHEVMTHVRQSFGLVFPSRWYETFGLVYIEGLSGGVPTLAFEPNVVAAAVAQEGTGHVGVWGGLEEALTAARNRFDGLRPHCRRVFEERYTERAFLDRRLSLYRELLS